MDPDAPLPLVTPDLLVATCSGTGEPLHCNVAWSKTFGDGALWAGLPEEDVRFADEYLTDATRGLLVTHQVFLVEEPEAEVPTPVLLHFLPVRLPTAGSGPFPVVITGEVLKEPVSWAADQTRRRRMEMLGQMAMGIAHDFNNLLTSILGNAELLRERLPFTPDADEARGLLATLEQAAGDGAALVRRIQQYIRHEKQERFEPVQLRTIVEEVITLTRPYWHNEPRRQGIQIELESDLSAPPLIQGSPTELREVLVNLVLNAVQAMPSGGVLRLRTYPHPSRGAVVEVEDTGVGMSEHVRARIFEPLFTTKGEGGTGMGLTVSYGIIQEHNGAVEVESEPGRGTLFRLSFPAAQKDARPAPDSGGAAPAERTDAPGLLARILVVDDEPMVRSVTANLLRFKGHTVAEAVGGAEALGLLDAGSFDLVITDLSMPEMNGRELARHVRDRHPGLPIILLTGDTDAHESADDLDAVVQKPYKLDALEAVIRQVLRPGDEGEADAEA
ncbi:MAG: response regulator [Rubricoccaceae bacterium]|nr:response regulator [Rubricoccaceae bacterium]